MQDAPNEQVPSDRAGDATIVIVGAGFSGTALAWRLLRAGEFQGRVVLIERAGRFGPGLAYGTPGPQALLNVPAGNMSLDEAQPTDFVDFLQSWGHRALPQDFVPRRWYGSYLATRLDEMACRAANRGRLLRVSGEATSVAKSGLGFSVLIEDGRRLYADRVVLATGHSPPTAPQALSALEGASSYVPDPWGTLPASRPGGRVLVVGTGLTMADVVCELLDRPDGPAQIIAASRHGRLPHVRNPACLQRGVESHDHCVVEPHANARRLVAAARQAARNVEARGGNWRDVIAALRVEAAGLWARLPLAEQRRFVRHAQPFWDVHRHLLPPQVGATLHAALRTRRLDLRAGRIVAAEPTHSGARVTLQPRGEAGLESLQVDQVILCTGPPADPASHRSRLVRELLAHGWLTADPTGCGLRVDSQGRPLDSSGTAVRGLYYLGPWLRARDWEATAVCELRRVATKLVDTLLQPSAANVSVSVRVAASQACRGQ